MYDVIKSAQQTISSAFQKAKAKINAAKAAVDRAFAKVDEWKRGENTKAVPVDICMVALI